MNEKSWMKNHLLRILWAWVITVLSAQFREKVVKCSPQITKPFKSSNHQITNPLSNGFLRSAFLFIFTNLLFLFANLHSLTDPLLSPSSLLLLLFVNADQAYPVLKDGNPFSFLGDSPALKSLRKNTENQYTFDALG